MPSSTNPGFSFSLSDHFHDKSEATSKLPGTPVAIDLPFSCEPVHAAPVNHGTARRLGVDRRAAGDFPVAREGVDELWGQRVLLVPKTETAVARPTPDEDASATRVNAYSHQGEGRCGGKGQDA